jgi:5-oxopent-3-ene-1,2,5-tricarboxylate decarboxylase/2-hydroxyhepta-2,4-diene-1,7-dioate isomerase
VAGALLNDFSLPHASYFRPPVRSAAATAFWARPADRAAGRLADLATLQPEVRVNGALRQTVACPAGAPAATLLADVNAFMTLRPGDVLMLGCDVGPDGHRPCCSG